MNDPRVVAFLAALRTDLGSFFPARAADERLREIAGHLEQAIAERSAEPDPVALALAEFGEAKGYRAAAEPRLARLPEREVVRLAFLTLLVPIGLDLLMDASSLLNGSDSSVALLSVPLTVYFAFRFLLASSRSRRFLFAPIAGATIACFALFLVLGGWTRATSEAGFTGSQSRGTAFRRREGLVRVELPRKIARQAELERGAKLFAAPVPTLSVGEFRVASGYLVPTLPDEPKGYYTGSRWRLDRLRYVPVPTYAAARKAWAERMPGMSRLAFLSLQGERQEIDELAQVVACPWGVSVAAEREPKSAMALVTFGWLLLLHGVGFLFGAISRNRRGRRLA